MKTLLSSLCLLIATSPHAKDLGMNPVFKHYVGTWKAAGELKGENNVLDIKEIGVGTAR